MSTKYKSSKDVPTDALISRLNELSDAITGGRDSLHREFTMRIPAECNRDADLVIGEAASRLTRLQSEVERLRGRCEELEELVHSQGRNNAELQRVLNKGATPYQPYILRKQAEAVDAVIKRIREARYMVDKTSAKESDTACTLRIAESIAISEAQRLRQQASDLKKAGGDHADT